MIVNNIHISGESFTGHVSSGGQDQNQKKAILKERQNTAVSSRVQLNTYAKVAKLQSFRAP